LGYWNTVYSSAGHSTVSSSTFNDVSASRLNSESVELRQFLQSEKQSAKRQREIFWKTPVLSEKNDTFAIWFRNELYIYIQACGLFFSVCLPATHTDRSSREQRRPTALKTL
jgi:hypothetical protein